MEKVNGVVYLRTEGVKDVRVLDGLQKKKCGGAAREVVIEGSSI